MVKVYRNAVLGHDALLDEFMVALRGRLYQSMML
jgi:hypothetical protein